MTSSHPPVVPRTSRDGLEALGDDPFDRLPGMATGTSQILSPWLYWTFFIYGFTFLLPWNVIVVQIPYFISRIEGTGAEDTFASAVITVSSVACFAFLWHATVTNVRETASRRAIQSLLWITVLNIKLLIMTLYTMPPWLFAVLVVFNNIGQSIAAAYLQTAFWAIGSLFGAHAIQALSVGGAAVGVVVGVIQVVGSWFSLLIKGHEPVEGSEITNGEAAASTAVVLLTITSIFLIGNIFLQWKLMHTREYKELVLQPDHGVPLEEMETLMSERRTEEKTLRGLTAKEMLWLNADYNIAMAYVFLITIMVFPAITGVITSVESPTTSIWLQPLMFNAIHFFLFNLGDLLSRYFPLVPWLFITSPRWLSFMSYSRTLFVPLFLLCKVNPSSQPVINSDLLFQLLVFLLGLTNGYLSATLQICAPSLEYNPKLRNRRIDVDTASTVIGFTLSIGLVLGGIASFAAKAAICSGGC